MLNKVLTFITLILPSITWADMYVTQINGSATATFDPYFSNESVQVGSYLHQAMDISLIGKSTLSIACIRANNRAPEIITISHPKQFKSACIAKTDLSELRAEPEESFPIVANPHMENILKLDHIEWGYTNPGNYKIILKAFGKAQPIYEKRLPAAKNQTLFQFSNLPIDTPLAPETRYQIEIVNTFNAFSSQQDTSFSGVFTLANHEQAEKHYKNAAEFSKAYEKEHLQHYFSAIYFRALGYYADSTAVLNATADLTTNPLFAYLKIQNSESQNLPLNFKARQWINYLRLLGQQSKISSALICINLRTEYPRLTPYWKKYIDNNKHKESFKNVCNLTDIAPN